MASDSTIGKIQSALMSATNEFVATAAQINFDFTMIKYEAPPEYQSLSHGLSLSRRQDAESGQAHVTARRLGALFEGISPSTPKLISAYGTRASEISRDVSTQGSVNVSNWIFSDYAGIDATSIWAAATSRKAALPVHLLACMLSRIWDDSEATSIWVEIVAERRKEIAAKFEGGAEVPISQTAAAVQGEITREQLSKWDASARAWLRTADTVKNLQQKQLLLIIKNISMPVNIENKPYQSIMTAWISALETIEMLIAGAPHVVQDGAVLIALSAWHLYPNMVVFSGADGGKEITMNDPLIHPGGILSLGFSDSGDRATRGVYWSLSLAHHKFYGRPILKSRQLDSDGSRMTFAELQQAVIGVIMAHWKVSTDDTVDVFKLLLQIASFLSSNPQSYEDRWIEMVTTPILSFFQDEESGLVPISFGRRRPRFIEQRPEGVEKPFFGLTDIPTLMRLISSSDHLIEFLRRISQRVLWLREAEPWIAYRAENEWCFATVFPIMFQNGRPILSVPTAAHDPDELDTRYHCRWVKKDKSSAGGRLSHSERVICSGPSPVFERSSRTIIRKHKKKEEFDFLFGDADRAAVFVRRMPPDHIGRTGPNVTNDDIRWCLQHDLITPADLRQHIFDIQSTIIQALILLSYTSLAYSSLSRQGATISPRILSAPFRVHVISSVLDRFRREEEFLYHRLDAVNMDSLAVIAYFETGFDILKARMNGVVGLSIGDSIYVPQKLTEDPASILPSYSYSRLLGNLGRPGLTILTCPTSPEAREIDHMAWRRATDIFTGTQDDYFNNTTLHLSFTDWKTALWIDAAVGQRDTQAMHLEAVVSIRDSGKWVADVDIVRALSHADVQPLPSQEGKCTHSTPQPPNRKVFGLETWDQILDCPDGILVTKSHGNWVARLALVSVLAQHHEFLGRKIVICPREVCWDCVDFPPCNVVYVY